MRRGLKDNFEMEGYRVSVAADGELGLQMALQPGVDLVVLDVMLPRMNGFEICKTLRMEKVEVPILMLTARDEEADVVRGLGFGADDYLTKPFRLREFFARCQVLLRRQGGEQAVEFGDFRFDPAAHRLERFGEEIQLSPKEYALLALFLKENGRALSREKILREVWGAESDVTPRTIDRFVTTLRGKLESQPGSPHFFETIREVGYRFNVPGTDEKS